ncbi:helix-turn-helix transcriptional regulator [Phenylobacterium sp.]|jgi:transcriptional regulator with XRE-family HTH domain|uniref:helix-turn-helix transcriptional regulator n=1 Tax=Phenylobacterium sp. TaxID=1871053 RepID=UPI0025D2EC2E|nr:helix-turn-helix transcriptional regulator [Phenylobacterium sp.]
MAMKKVARTYSRYGREAVGVLGYLIRIHRLERKLSVAEVAERVGVSRYLIQRIESGDPRCAIGVAFEAASILGVTLFEEDRYKLTARIREQEEKLRLLPKAIHKPRTTAKAVKDDF